MKKCALSILVVSSLGLVGPTAVRPADACGGCFVPTETVTNVEAHRMVIALSPKETILWDQIQYSGNPEDFVWVLPVPSPEISVELADPAFFDEIDSQTTPIVRPSTPLFPCNGSAGCGSDGASSTSGVDTMTMPEDEVTVFAEETIGPYETVVIGSEDAGALRTWLTENGYNVAAETEPIIDHYIDSKSVFVVLRLAPGEGVQAMQPIRIRYPGYMGVFPLKMVTVGSRGLVALSLWVIAEQRYEARNYTTVKLDENRLEWDWSTNKSNYGEAFDQTIQNMGGRAWVVEYASRLSQLVFSTRELDQVYAEQPFPYVTRLRTSMLVDYLNDDLILQPARDSGDVFNNLTAFRELNRPGGDCDQAQVEEYGCAAAATGAEIVSYYGPTLIILLGFALYRRRRRRAK